MVVQVDPKFPPVGKRFLIKEYPKDKEPRPVKLSSQLVDKLVRHVEREGLGQDDLVFCMRLSPSPADRLRAIPNPADLDFTKPNPAGRRYRHRTMSAYNAGRCKCQHCRDAAAIYRANRRAAGLDSPRKPRVVDTDGHIPRDWFREQVWKPAVKQAGIAFAVRTQDLRHAHASWLLTGGADLQMVKERLGHGSISTTERYLHTLPDAGDEAVDAFSRIRSRAAHKPA